MRNKSTEHFSGLPYIYALLNCLICLWYGSPLVSSDNILVLTVNSVGAVFQLTYSVIFTLHADRNRKVSFSSLSEISYQSKGNFLLDYEARK